MFIVKAENLELRGVLNQTSKNGKVYYILNTENPDGTPEQLYCPDASALPPQLKKGDLINVEFEVKRYQGSERLNVRKVNKVS